MVRVRNTTCCDPAGRDPLPLRFHLSICRYSFHDSSSLLLPLSQTQESPLDLVGVLSAAGLTSGEITRAPRPLSKIWPESSSPTISAWRPSSLLSPRTPSPTCFYLLGRSYFLGTRAAFRRSCPFLVKVGGGVRRKQSPAGRRPGVEDFGGPRKREPCPKHSPVFRGCKTLGTAGKPLASPAGSGWI